MIEISLDKCEGGRYIFSACGHAAYCEGGDDIVCAAVSTLVFTLYRAVCALDTRGDISRFYHTLSKGEALLDFTVKERALDAAGQIVDSYMEGFVTVADKFPENVSVI